MGRPGDEASIIQVLTVQGYKQRKGFIIAQSPTVTTARDFIKMLYERECGVVVMLCGCEEGEVEVCAQYWPATAGTTMKYGEFMVSTVSINDTNNGFIQRAIAITDPEVRYIMKGYNPDQNKQTEGKLSKIKYTAEFSNLYSLA